MKKTIAALAIAAALSPVVSAQAGTITSTHSIGMTNTNWIEAFSLGKFDSSLGTLTSIRFDLSGSLQGSGKAESMDSDATTVTLSLGSLLGLARPDGSTLVVTNPLFTHAFSFSAYDGVFDFGGNSGGTTGTVTASGANFFVSNNASDFALFSALGGGIINLGMSAVGNSSGTGSGNLITQFNTGASATATVTYTYAPAVEIPEPASLATIIGGLGLMGALRRQRTRKA